MSEYELVHYNDNRLLTSILLFKISRLNIFYKNMCNDSEKVDHLKYNISQNIYFQIESDLLSMAISMKYIYCVLQPEQCI